MIFCRFGSCQLRTAMLTFLEGKEAITQIPYDGVWGNSSRLRDIWVQSQAIGKHQYDCQIDSVGDAHHCKKSPKRNCGRSGIPESPTLIKHKTEENSYKIPEKIRRRIPQCESIHGEIGNAEPDKCIRKSHGQVSDSAVAGQQRKRCGKW